LFFFFSTLTRQRASSSSLRISFHARITATDVSRLYSCTGLRNAVLAFGRRIVVVRSVCGRIASGIPPGIGIVYGIEEDEESVMVVSFERGGRCWNGARRWKLEMSPRSNVQVMNLTFKIQLRLADRQKWRSRLSE
jgi:hypothetical protein